MNQDQELTSEELEETLELLWELLDFNTSSNLRIRGVLGDEYSLEVLSDKGFVELPANVTRHLASAEIASVTKTKNNTYLTRYCNKDVLDYFQNLKRQRNLKALLKE